MAPDPLSFVCPRCHGVLEHTAPNEFTCAGDGLHFQNVSGIWRFLLPERQPHYSAFIQDYETIRRGERRGSTDPAYYRAIPYRRLYHDLAPEWDIRAASFDLFRKHILTPLETSLQRPLQVLDLGAGNGWLSNRLALRGHQLAAVDLTDNQFDGLGCYAFFEAVFTPVQAEFDRLPFQEGTFDLVVFNAALHYSEDYLATLNEALRILTSSGKIAILDSPIYKEGSSGARMVKEREAQFQQRFGFRSDALPSQNYLTYAQLDALQRQLGIAWIWFTPDYGIRWRLRPIKAKLLGQREPAKFHVFLGMRAAG